MTADNRFTLEGVPLPTGAGAEALQTLAAHVSVRAFKPDPVPDSLLNAILVAARSGSTSNNLQSYSIIVVTDQQKRAALSEIAGRQAYVKDSPVFLVFCPDLYRLKLVCERQGHEFADRKMEMFLQAVVDATIAGQNAAVAAEASGLGIVYIGAIRNKMREAAEVLELPPGVFALFGLCIGYPAVRNGIKPRLPQEATVHLNSYSTAALEQALASYDQTMIKAGVYAGRQVSASEVGADAPKPYGWCEHTARRLSRENPNRSMAVKILEELGFEF